MATSTFLLLDKIKGESTDSDHVDWIELMSFACGVSQPMSSPGGVGGRGGARADFQAFSTSQFVDKSTCDQQMFCAAGTHIAEATLEVCQETGKKECYWSYVFTNLMIQSVSISGGGSERPVMNCSYVYDTIKVIYTPIDDKGDAGAKTEKTWSLVESVAK